MLKPLLFKLSGLGTRDSGLGTRDSGLGTRWAWVDFWVVLDLKFYMFFLNLKSQFYTNYGFYSFLHKPFFRFYSHLFKRTPLDALYNG